MLNSHSAYGHNNGGKSYDMAVEGLVDRADFVARKKPLMRKKKTALKARRDSLTLTGLWY